MVPPPYSQTPTKKKLPVWAIVVFGVMIVGCCCPLSFSLIRYLAMSPADRAKYDQKFKDEELKRQMAQEKADKELDTKAKEAIKKIDAINEREKHPYTISNLSSTTEDGLGFVTGIITNNTTTKKGYVQVEINLLDKSGTVVGSTLANINNLDPGQKWKFKAMVTDKEAAKFEVKDVTGF